MPFCKCRSCLEEVPVTGKEVSKSTLKSPLHAGNSTFSVLVRDIPPASYVPGEHCLEEVPVTGKEVSKSTLSRHKKPTSRRKFDIRCTCSRYPSGQLRSWGTGFP